MKKLIAIATLLLHTLLCLNAQNITTFGAIADGETNNAAVIQKLIDKVSIEGGGTEFIITLPFKTNGK